MAAANQALLKKKEEDCYNEIEKFKTSISEHEYQEELLEEIFP